MRRRLVGLVAAMAMLSAVGGVTASPAVAAESFVKTLFPTSVSNNGCTPTTPSGTRHGTAAFTLTRKMSATVSLRGALHHHGYGFLLMASTSNTPSGNCGSHLNLKTQKGPIFTDGHGNATVHLGPAPRSGNPCGVCTPVGRVASFWIYVSDFHGSSFMTARVPVSRDRRI